MSKRFENTVYGGAYWALLGFADYLHQWQILVAAVYVGVAWLSHLFGVGEKK